jgi:hypothetical protein
MRNSTISLARSASCPEWVLEATALQILFKAMRMRSHPPVLNLIDFFLRPQVELATEEA